MYFGHTESCCYAYLFWVLVWTSVFVALWYTPRHGTARMGKMTLEWHVRPGYTCWKVAGKKCHRMWYTLRIDSELNVNQQCSHDEKKKKSHVVISNMLYKISQVIINNKTQESLETIFSLCCIDFTRVLYLFKFK